MVRSVHVETEDVGEETGAPGLFSSVNDCEVHMRQRQGICVKTEANDAVVISAVCDGNYVCGAIHIEKGLIRNSVACEGDIDRGNVSCGAALAKCDRQWELILFDNRRIMLVLVIEMER